MPLDPHARRFLDRLQAVSPAAASPPPALSVAARRSALAQLLALGAARALACEVQEREIPGPGGALRLRTYAPAATANSPALLPGLVYFHGGGFVAGTLDSHDPICRRLSHASGCRLVAVDYRLAPEHRFPAALEDALMATRWVAAHAGELGIDPRRLGVCGDSAGATLAAVICQAAAAGGPPLALQVLICPIMDYGAQTESRRRFGRGYFLDEATLRHDLEHYLGADDDLSDPRISPLRATALAGLPPSCIHTAEYDPLRDEAADYAQRLQQAGVPTTYRCHLGMIHLFYGMEPMIPYAASGLELIGADVRAALGAVGLASGERA